MIKAYSLNQTIGTNSNISFYNVPLLKGKSVTLSGSNTLTFNKKGIYMVAFNLVGLASTAGDITINMYKNGVAQPDASETITGASTTIGNTISIATLVQVPNDNNCSCCSSPTTITFKNDGTGVAANNLSVVVTKIC